MPVKKTLLVRAHAFTLAATQLNIIHGMEQHQQECTKAEQTNATDERLLAALGVVKK